MSLSPQQMDKFIDEHFGYEANDNVEGVLATLSDNATHDIVGWRLGPTQGREGARPFYETLFADLANGKVTCLKRLYGENFLVDDSVWEGKAVGAPFGFQGNGRPLRFRLLHVVEFTDDGHMKRENVWCDFLDIIRQLPQG